MRIDCDEVSLADSVFKIIKRGGDLVLTGHTVAADHTLHRGIYRKTRPWLYVHHIEADKVDITFDSGSKEQYPLYTGASGSIFNVFAHPWEMTRSTNAAFPRNYWLVSHRWSGTGIFFDLQQQIGDETRWRLVQGDIFVSGDGTEVTVSEIGASVKIISFDAEAKKALVKFSPANP